MAALVKFGSIHAVLSNGRWACDNEQVLRLLEGRLARDRDNLSGSDPNPEYSLAKMAADALGGEVAEYDTPAFNPNVIY